jgi:DNA-binding transcriptional LysR family regulator
MDLASLSAFVKVVQNGSFTKAAAALDSHKAQLSRTIAAMERDLGIRLLERTTRRVTLTQVGREVYHQALAVLGGVEDIRRTATLQQGEPRGVLRLTTSTEFGLIGLNRWLATYAERYPEVRIDVDLTGRRVDLGYEGFDLAILLGPADENDGAVHKLGEISYGLYASPRYLERNGTPEDGDQVSRHRLLSASRGQRGGWRLVTLSREIRVADSARLSTNNSAVIREAAVQGLGIALLPNALAKEDVSRGVLRRVLSAWSAPRMPVNAVTPLDRQIAPKARAFIDLALEFPVS